LGVEYDEGSAPGLIQVIGEKQATGKQLEIRTSFPKDLKKRETIRHSVSNDLVG